MGRLARTAGVLLAILVVVGALAVGAFVAGVVQKPTAGVEDYGDWGEVTADRTEVVTTLWVDNPNVVGLAVGDEVGVSYRLVLNGVALAGGEKRGIAIEPGNNTVPVSTYVRNDEIAPFWVAFVGNDETIHLRAEPSATVDAGPLTTTADLPTQRKTLLANSTPVIDALSRSAAALEGNYTRSVTVGTGPASETVVVGYQVRRGWATWGPVTRERTTVRFHFEVHNPSETVPVPAVPDGLGMSVDMNDVRLFRAQGEALSPRNVDGDAVIRPGHTQTVVLEVTMDNSKVDEWFRSHVRRGERTTIATQLQLVYRVEGETFRLPKEGPTYTCRLRTAILVDGRNTSTTCLAPESVPGGGALANATDGSRDGTDTPDGTATDDATTPTSSGTATPAPTPTPSPTPTATPTESDQPPTARASANRTEGEAPLAVSFDAGASSDPDGDVVRYVWRFDDGSLPAEGETVTHTFRTAGTYEVELVVFDGDGNSDSVTVTITVDPAGV